MKASLSAIGVDSHTRNAHSTYENAPRPLLVRSAECGEKRRGRGGGGECAEVRAAWDDADRKWWYCAVDVVAALSESTNPSNYWYVLKNRLKKSAAETLTNCKGFKLVAKDGKHRMVKSVVSADDIKRLLNGALTNKINDREMFMKGIDYSYYYEEQS